MKAERIILGENACFSSDCEDTQLNNNIIVCGSSGSGKTMSIAEPRLLETFHSSLIVTVTKRRLVKKYAKVFKERGYEVLDLNFAEPEASQISFDPLHYISSYEDITFLANSIVNATKRREQSNADPFWDQGAVSLLSAEIAYVLMRHGAKATFADVLKLHTRLDFNGEAEIRTSLDNELNHISSESFAAGCWRSFRNLPRRTASCLFTTLNVTIDTVFTPSIRDMISKKKTVDFERLATKKTVLFVSTSATNPSLNTLVNLFYASAFKELFELAECMPDGKLPVAVNMLMDDFASGGRITNFPEYISVFREKGISVELLIQSESQLESMYDKDNTSTILNCCDTYVYLGGMDLATGRNISERLNLPLEEVLYMPVGQVVVFRRGQKPIVTKRYDVLNDKEYKRITKEYEDSTVLTR